MAAFLTRFYSKNLFERIIVYVFLSELIAKLYIEVALGQLLFYHPQAKQWIFYILLGVVEIRI